MRPTMLVVDDDRDLLDTLAEQFGLPSPGGYEVVTAGSGAEALELIRCRLFDAALVDIWMSGIGGLELLREMKRHDPALEVVMMTGEPTVDTAVQSLKEGAYDYIAKPLNLDELRHLIGRLMEHSLLRREVRTLRTRLGEDGRARADR